MAKDEVKEDVKEVKRSEPKLDWVLETQRDVEYHLPKRDDTYRHMCESYEKGTLEEDFPLQVKRLQGKTDATPEKLHSMDQYKNSSTHKPLPKIVVYKSDRDGTIKIKPEDEEHAIALFKAVRAVNPKCYFNEKWGAKMPTEIREMLEREAKQLEEMRQKARDAYAQGPRTVIF